MMRPSQSRTCWNRRLAVTLSVTVGLAGCQQLVNPTSRRAHEHWGRPAAGIEGLGQTSTRPMRSERINLAQEADVQIALGQMAEKRGDQETAMLAYRAALTRDKNRADAYARLAVLHDQQGKFRQSADLYEKALQLRPGDPDIYCDMGYSLYLQNRWEEAERNLKQALALKLDHSRARNNLGLVLAQTDRLDAALSEFRKAGCSPAEAHGNLAFALCLSERWDLAQTHYEQALALKPSTPDAEAQFKELNALAARFESDIPRPRLDPNLLPASDHSIDQP